MNDAPSITSDSPSREPDLSGRQLGDYELIRRLGRGGMADVYLAKQTSLERQVAVKVLRSSLPGEEKDNYIRRLHQEARAAASLVHANIVQIHEVGCIDNHHFIVQEYVPGLNLKQYIQRNGPVDARQAIQIMRQVAAALHRSASAKITHRDIKPENIMLAPTGEVKVADFGLARVASNSGGLDLTQVGITMGTPLYMSPEQVEGRATDPRSDLYSLGVTCFHMLVGRPPFEGETALSVAVQHLHQEPERLEKLRKDLPPALCQIVHKLMHKNPADRYQAPSELLRDLRALRIEVGEDDWPAGAEDWDDSQLSSASDGRWEATMQLAAVMKTQALSVRRQRRRMICLAALFVCAFVGGVTAAWFRRPDPLLAIDAREVTRYEHLENARAQYFYALLNGSEGALLSVAKHFPPEDSPDNRYYARMAQRQLAELYMSRDQLDKAMEIYTQLANVEELEHGFRATGLLGQAAVHFRRKEMQRAAARLAEAEPLLRSMSDIEFNAMLDQLDRELRDRLLQMRSEPPFTSVDPSAS